MCEEKDCIDGATSDSSVSGLHCKHLTSGDQCSVVSSAGYTGSASILTCTLGGVNGSVSLIGGLLNCSATGSAVDGIPSGMSHACDGIAFRESCCANCSDCYVPVDVTYSTLSCGSNSFRIRDTPSFYSVRTVLHGPSSALLNDDTVEGLDCSSLTLGKACVVTCSDGYTAAGDTEITMTCIFDLELTSMLLEGSTPSCQRASGDLSTLMPRFTANHDCPNTLVIWSYHTFHMLRPPKEVDLYRCMVD